MESDAHQDIGVSARRGSYEADLAAPTGTNDSSAPSRAAAVHDSREPTQGFFGSELHSKHSRTLRVVQPPHAPTSPACRVIAGRPDPQFVGPILLFSLLNWTSSRRVWHIDPGAGQGLRQRQARVQNQAGRPWRIGSEPSSAGASSSGSGRPTNTPSAAVTRQTAAPTARARCSPDMKAP